MSDLLNSKQIAAQLHRAPTYLSAMKAAGYRMRYCGRDRLETGPDSNKSPTEQGVASGK